MINTKLILIDGLPGSGKSSIAHYITRQLEKNGIKFKMFNEIDRDHPLDHDYDIEDEIEYMNEYLKQYPVQWKEFVEMVKSDDCIYVIESYLYQKILCSLLFYDFERQILKDFSHELCSSSICLNLVIIHLKQLDVGTAMRNNFQLRGTAWEKWFVELPDRISFCKNRNISGESGSIEYFQEFGNISNELYDESELKKIQIDVSQGDWDEYRKQILDFLEIPLINEVLYEKSFEKYCGNYTGIEIHSKDDQLYIDTFWTNMKLIPLEANKFQIEGFPVIIEFIQNENDKITLMKIIKSLYFFKAGVEYLKIIPPKLEKFCGDYWCESDQVDVKIFLKDDKLYYSKTNAIKLQLIPKGNNMFALRAYSINSIEFEFVDGEYQYTFDVKGDNPSNSLFVKKSEKVNV